MTIDPLGGPGTAQPPPVKPKLLHLVRQAIRIRHYSPRTEEAYVHWIRRYIFFHGLRHPADMGKPELTAFLSHLAVRECVSASTQTQALSALVFLYRNVLGGEVGLLEGVVRAKRPARLPVVLTRDEARQLFAHMDGVVLLACRLLYGSGLRLLECLHMRVKDIEFDRNEITVRDGKGQKDRVTMLPASCKQPLRDHLAKMGRQHEDDLRQGLGLEWKSRMRRELHVRFCEGGGVKFPPATRPRCSADLSGGRGTDLACHHGGGRLMAMATRSPREQILDALQDLPADATFDDAIERLVFLAKIDAGLAELDEGKRIPHDEAKRRLGL